MENKECESSDMFELGIKLKDKLLELQTKRTVLKDLDNKIQKSQLDMHEYQRNVEKTKREIKEMSVQLDVAIGVARSCETDRMANREILAMQKIQLQAAIMDRESLQEQVRALEVENVKIKRSLQQSDEKLIKQHLLQERCKNKENQMKKSIEHLVSQIKSVEESHEKLMHMFAAIHQTSQNITHQLNSKTDLITKLESEKLKLQEQVLSLTNFTLKMDVEEQIDKNNVLDIEHENVLQDMENANREKEKEINELQKTLDITLKSIKCLQEKNKSFEDEIKALKSEKCLISEKSPIIEKTIETQESDEKLTTPKLEEKNQKRSKSSKNDVGSNKKIK